MAGLETGLMDVILIMMNYVNRRMVEEVLPRAVAETPVGREVDVDIVRKGERQTSTDHDQGGYVASTPVDSGGDDFLAAPDDDDTSLPFDF